jgi:hypothetical protein
LRLEEERLRLEAEERARQLELEAQLPPDELTELLKERERLRLIEEARLEKVRLEEAKQLKDKLRTDLEKMLPSANSSP